MMKDTIQKCKERFIEAFDSRYDEEIAKCPPKNKFEEERLIDNLASELAFHLDDIGITLTEKVVNYKEWRACFLRELSFMIDLGISKNTIKRIPRECWFYSKIDSIVRKKYNIFRRVVARFPMPFFFITLFLPGVIIFKMFSPDYFDTEHQELVYNFYYDYLALIYVLWSYYIVWFYEIADNPKVWPIIIFALVLELTAYQMYLHEDVFDNVRLYLPPFMLVLLPILDWLREEGRYKPIYGKPRKTKVFDEITGDEYSVEID